MWGNPAKFSQEDKLQLYSEIQSGPEVPEYCTLWAPIRYRFPVDSHVPEQDTRPILLMIRFEGLFQHLQFWGETPLGLLSPGSMGISDMLHIEVLCATAATDGIA
jgi:hypothetical protein